MEDLDIDDLKDSISKLVDQWYKGEVALAKPSNELPQRILPKDKRIVRTKTSGDRVYILDEIKKTRQWVTSPEVLKSLGFELSDAIEIDDADLFKYQMSSPLYRVVDENE
jgi:hypothetical protein